MLLFPFLTSCKKDFLEFVPKGSQVAVTTADYDLLLNNPYFYNVTGGLKEFVLMGDEVGAEADLFGQHKVTTVRAFQYQAMIYDAKDLPIDLSSQLSNMYTFNKIINEVMGSAEGSDGQKKILLAEAKAQRAALNFLLVNYYGKPYEASSAATDPAFPLVTTADISATGFKRASVKEMYDAIVKDLTEAIAVLPKQNVVLTRMSKAAAEALLGKAYLFMGRSADALPLLKTALTDAVSGPIPVKLYDYNVTLGPGGDWLPISSYNGPSNGPGNNFNDFGESVWAKTFQIDAGYYDGNDFEHDGLVLTPGAAALYGASDWRLQLYTDQDPNGNTNAGGRLRKYGVAYIKFGMQLSELYLLNAEVKARTNDLAGAVADVETLRKNRMPSADAKVPSPTAGNQAALIKFIIDERTREFAMEGYRWFDMRRLSVDPLFTGVTYTHTLYSASRNTTYTLKQPERLTLQLPLFYINANPGMANNP